MAKYDGGFYKHKFFEGFRCWVKPHSYTAWYNNYVSHSFERDDEGGYTNPNEHDYSDVFKVECCEYCADPNPDVEPVWTGKEYHYGE